MTRVYLPGSTSAVDANSVVSVGSPDTGANAAARIAVAHEAPLNVEWPEYGASPSASQAANTTRINAAVAALPSNGGEILLPRRYATSGTISLDDRENVQLVGLNGMWNGASGIDYHGTGTAVSVRGTGGSTDGCLLKNFGVADAAGTAAKLIDLGTSSGTATDAGSSDCKLEGMFLYGPSSAAILLRLAQATSIHVETCKFSGGSVQVQGIDVAGGFCNAITIDGQSYFTGASTIAVRSLGAGCLIAGNTFEPLSGAVAGAYLQDTAYPGRALAWIGNWTGDSTSGTWITYNGESLTVLGGLLDSAVNGILLNGETDGIDIEGVWFASLTNGINLNSQTVTRFRLGAGNRYNSVTNPVAGQTTNANGTAWGTGSQVTDANGNLRISNDLVVDDGDTTRLRIGNHGGGAPIIYFGAAEDTAIYRNAAKQLRTSQQFIASDGLTTKTKAGVPTDADFAVTPGDGTLVVDTTDNKIYVRIGGAWKSAAVA